MLDNAQQFDLCKEFLDSKILIAVSGGSDSLALMLQLAENFTPQQLSVATVDHQLRTESAQEAKGVGMQAHALGLDHETLVWNPTDRASSADAREARYGLLASHAKKIDASIIALGHTLDDQAETLVMRAIRMGADSETRGLAGMGEWASYRDIKLWRPLLNQSRYALRNHLLDLSMPWTDDPSNEKISSERVRVRRFLNGKTDRYPEKNQIAKLAQLSARSRHWINHKTAQILQDQVTRQKGSTLVFTPDKTVPCSLILETVSLLILLVGGKAYRTPSAKLLAVAEAFGKGEFLRKSIGHCVIKVSKGQIEICREYRNGKPHAGTDDQVFHLDALQKFRPKFDDCLYEVVLNRFVHPFCST